MRIFSLILYLNLPILLFSQTLYNPQQLYDSPGGLYDKDSLRSVNIDFYM